MNKPKILLLSNHNSCRSQIAEGLMNRIYGDRVEIQSAGSNPFNFVNESAVQVLKEISIDISQNVPKSARQVFANHDTIDYVIAMSSDDETECPIIFGRLICDDPSAMPPEGNDGIL